MILNQFPDRTINHNNKEYLYFGGTNYLGIGTNPNFQNILFENLKKWGSSFGSSRNANVQLKVYDDTELYLSKFVGSQDSILVSSGMLAGKLVVDQLGNTTDTFYNFPNLHAALYSPNSLPFFIANEINPKLLTDDHENSTILIDGIPAMYTKPIDLAVLNQISKSKKITLVIDESHTFGILGTVGSGLFGTINLAQIHRTIMIASLGKVFGLTGGFIASDFEFCNQIRNQSSFISAAGMNPAFAQTFIDAKKLYELQFHKLQLNLDFFYNRLESNSGIDFSSNYPIINILSEDLNTKLIEKNIIITNFKYATTSKNLNRIIITANHTFEDLEKLLAVLNKK